MDGKWRILLFLSVIGVGSVFGQSFQYQYTDPCTGLLNTVTISQPNGSVTLFYAGQWQTFTQSQLLGGGYEQWIAQINSQFPPGSNPCAGNGSQNATTLNTATTTNLINNVSGIVGIATSIGSQAAGSVNVPPPTNTSTSNGSNDGSNNSSGSGSGGSSGSTSGGSSTGGGSGSSGGGGSGSSGGGGSGSSGGGGSGSSGGGGSGRPDGGGGSTGGGQPSSGQGEGGGGTSPTSGGGTTEGGGAPEGAVGGQENTTTASGGESESSSEGGGGGGGKQKSKQEKVGRGALIGSGDFVVIRNGSDISKGGGDNFRFNTSLTHVNTKQNFIKGVNFNYTTGENILNATFYGSYKTQKFMGVFSNSTMTNFKSDIFNTTTVLAAQKLGFITGMLGTNLTIGKIGESNFGNWSLVGGGFTNFKGGKLLSSNVMLLGVYSPYIFYYQGQWYNSGVLLVPLMNVDMKLTDKFKWSISFSGAYQYGVDILNFQLSTGTKMLL